MGFSKKVEYAKPFSLNTLQVNVGLLCNKMCSHCHVKAGPDRKEIMNRDTMERVIWFADKIEPNLVDITGGAPEMNPNIRWLIRELFERGYKTQLRTNLTALLLDISFIGFLVQHRVKLVASLPCFEAAEVDSVRGDGTFNDCIRVLRKLNQSGYGIEDGLDLDLVFNPEADFLPPSQDKLEETFHERLRDDFGVRFTHLITIANMPIGRFREDLEKSGRLGNYMELLHETFNPDTVNALMCRKQVNVNWNGDVYDCDFNLALGLKMKLEHSNICDPEFDLGKLLKREIVYGEHCFGCTAGQGSSCNGALTG